jgi:hypothetical protein
MFEEGGGDEGFSLWDLGMGFSWSGLAVGGSLSSRTSLISCSIAAIVSAFGVKGDYFLGVNAVAIVSYRALNSDVEHVILCSRLVLAFWRLSMASCIV